MDRAIRWSPSSTSSTVFTTRTSHAVGIKTTTRAQVKKRRKSNEDWMDIEMDTKKDCRVQTQTKESNGCFFSVVPLSKRRCASHCYYWMTHNKRYLPFCCTIGWGIYFTFVSSIIMLILCWESFILKNGRLCGKRCVHMREITKYRDLKISEPGS